ncbi:MAG TPA: zf-HC2 domain-containing protein [Elusimicrobiota bacterium]|nr:zf-HC2 domain-containing protein [Elusimicrobiota bacterium]
MDAHIKELISAYLDKALPEAERARVEAHAAACAECRAELEDTRRVSAMVAGLPKRELPVGFMERLQRRRAAEESPASAVSWFPAPARMAAFAAAGLVAGLIVYQKGRAGLHYEPAASHFADTRGFDSRGVSLKGLPEPPPPAAPEPRPPSMDDLASSAAGSSAADAKAAPAAPAADSMTNEQLHGFLDQEQKRMGIREIAAPRAANELQRERADGAQPMSRAEAMAVVRQMTDDIARANAFKAMKTSPVVALDGGSAPRLLSKSEEGPMEEYAAKPAVASGAGAGSVAMVSSGKDSFDVSMPVAAQAGAAGAIAPAAKRAPQSSALRKAAATRGLTQAAPGGFGRAAAQRIPTAGSWQGQSSTLRGPGTATAGTDAEWAALWERLDPETPAPAADLSRYRAVAVFGARGQTSVKVLSISSVSGKIVVLYAAAGTGSDGTPYRIALIPRSSAPVVFQKAR